MKNIWQVVSILITVTSIAVNVFLFVLNEKKKQTIEGMTNRLINTAAQLTGAQAVIAENEDNIARIDSLLFVSVKEKERLQKISFQLEKDANSYKTLAEHYKNQLDEIPDIQLDNHWEYFLTWTAPRPVGKYQAGKLHLQLPGSEDRAFREDTFSNGTSGQHFRDGLRKLPS